MSTQMLRVVSPADGEVIAERTLATPNEIEKRLARARIAQREWRKTSIEDRCALLEAFVAAFINQRDLIAHEITLQMGRPISHSPGEVGRVAERSRHMISIAAESLQAVQPASVNGFRRFVRRDPFHLRLATD